MNSCLAFLAVSFASLLRAIMQAAEGYQDEDGFHFGSLDELAAKAALSPDAGCS